EVLHENRVGEREPVAQHPLAEVDGLAAAGEVPPRDRGDDQLVALARRVDPGARVAALLDDDGPDGLGLVARLRALVHGLVLDVRDAIGEDEALDALEPEVVLLVGNSLGNFELLQLTHALTLLWSSWPLRYGLCHTACQASRSAIGRHRVKRRAPVGWCPPLAWGTRRSSPCRCEPSQ